jgi:predicted nucleic acid-binding protein
VFGVLAAEIRRAGRRHRYRVQDIWLASQAIQHGYRLLTRNRRDFDDIPGLDLVVIG